MAADDSPPAPGETPSLDLEAIRRGIDEVDRRLVALLAERARLVGQVVHYKRARHMAVVDRAREERMLDRIGGLAEQAGLDARVARQVLRTIIDGFTLLEVEELGPDFGPVHDGPVHDSPVHDSPGHDSPGHGG